MQKVLLPLACLPTPSTPPGTITQVLVHSRDIFRSYNNACTDPQSHPFYTGQHLVKGSLNMTLETWRRLGGESISHNCCNTHPGPTALLFSE